MIRPVLAAPDLDKEFRVEANTSNYTTKEVLLMKCSDDLWKPVYYEIAPKKKTFFHMSINLKDFTSFYKGLKLEMVWECLHKLYST